MSFSAPLLSGSIEPDDDTAPSVPKGNIGSSSSTARPPAERVVLVPGTQAGGVQTSLGSAEEGGIRGILKQSSHPMALAVLFLFRSAAIAVYVLCGLFTDNYVLSIVMVVVLLSLDFWNTRNVAGRTLVGLRYWNEVDEEGESSWVFECRDPSRAANPVDAKMFWIALYAYPLGWLALFIVSLLKFSVSFLPIVALALVFNLSNLVGFTYADRDAQKRWASGIASGNLFGFGMGGIGGQLVGGAVKNTLGKVFG
ncbi:cytoplasmic protein [Cryptococcus wingfieldii CBS 7118]|uniref:Golgi apparatus membrane protein TVP23 n=1 Tax=Cryptococcus wingfieldii CBS 7118 TaxID=1295528 RepID=A0A1E3ITY1_9TREE|nr:cytoplasmic protein [Cryptococcus wingfieldii CBS 7118]ODN92022.1 cytoplasmic protein [Cryptococcus wingfieldii CBS 7118]